MVNPPNLFVIGAPRCGTTSLYSALKQHPQIYTSVLKEPHFYAKDMPIQPHTVTDINDYESLFASAESEIYRAEASVWYLYSHSAASLIAKKHVDARIIVLLRNPVQMIISLYNLYLRTGNENQADPDIALLRGHEEKHDNCYFSFGLYYRRLLKLYEALKRWSTYFSSQQMRVIFFEEFYESPEKNFEALCEWLDLENYGDISFNENEARKRVKSKAMRQLRHLSKPMRKKMNPLAPALHSQKKHTTVSNDILKELQKESSLLLEKLPQIIGRELPTSWL